MQASPRVVIVGGGTAGWMTAAAFARSLGGRCGLTLVESDEIGTIGVGEASIPNLIEFNRALGLDENEFLRECGGSFKLGIEFVNWGAVGERYIHGFGQLGAGAQGLPFHHFWLRGQRLGCAAELGDYALNTAAPRAARFMRARPDMAGSPLAELAHAFHFDASRYAAFLRRYAEARGVQRIEGRVTQVTRRAEGGIAAIELANGTRIDGDFFIDCSGQHGLLIQQTLQAGFEDWSHWLPCDRAWAVPSEAATPLLPMTRATAHSAGWQWRIPLQHRLGNGHVFASRFMTEEDARTVLLDHLDTPAQAEPRLIRFRTGRAKRFWVGNCVAVGLSSGFLEPLESTSIHLIHMAVARILDFFPHGKEIDPADVAEYNALTTREYENIRDFLALHYKLTRRDDSEFWRYCRSMPIPDTLQRKLDLFAANGRVIRHSDELFAEVSWVQVMLGQGLMPRGHHPFADQLSEPELRDYLDHVRQVIARCVQAMPEHADYLRSQGALAT
ncbi:tryptophan halogenase family protein [Roseateles paludis]|uniref:Tryptophan halogenase family protein n=1 Tax=Roseateles paludis TaxID=3145238 RepID=A0ABV0FYD1_9BURK